MPIYEYQCHNCKLVEEHLMRFSDPDPTNCPKCNGPVSKLVSQTSFALKGEGWYVTDYKAKPKSESKPGEVEAASQATAAAGSEAKPDASQVKSEAGLATKSEPSAPSGKETKSEAPASGPKLPAQPSVASSSPKNS
jgi:putative FmdB family regulatory protein